MMNKKKRTHILQRLYEHDCYSKIQFNSYSPFEILIFAILSAKSKESVVKQATNKLFSIANTPKDILKLNVEELSLHIKTIGLFNRKSENIIKTCQILLKHFNGKVPENRRALESFPGVGRKTANLVLSMAFKWPVIAVDTHVFRVCNRTNFACGKNVRKVEEKLLKVVPKKFIVHCHNLLMLHGRHICISRKPLCRLCVINDLCLFKRKSD